MLSNSEKSILQNPKYCIMYILLYTCSEALELDWFIAAGVYPSFCSTKPLGVFLLPLDGIATPLQVTPLQFVRFPQQFAGTQLYSWVERGIVRVKCLAQEHNTVSLARDQTWTA